MNDYEPLIRSVSRHYFWPGAEQRDVEQEARYALLKGQPKSFAHAKVMIKHHLIEQVRRETRRRPQFSELIEAEAPDNLIDLLDARETLRRFARVALTGLEREALSRRVGGKRCPRGRLDNAAQRVRQKFQAAKA